MIRRPPRSTLSSSSAASDVYKRQPIYTDIRMVEAGITKHGHKCPITCVLERGGELAQTHQITRTSAGFLDIGTELEDSIIVIGNAPSAAITVCRLVEQGIRPA